MPLTPHELLHHLRWRYAVKKFDPTKKIPADVWEALEGALVLTPSSYGMQPWRFVIVTDQAVKEKLVAASWGQKQPAECSHLLVIATHPQVDEAHVDRHVTRTAEVRSQPLESLTGMSKMLSGFVKNLPDPQCKHWADLQAYIALGNFMTAAAVLGIDTCPMEGIIPQQYDELLGSSLDDYRTLVAAAAGYRSPEDKYAGMAKVRFKPEEVLRRI